MTALLDGVDGASFGNDAGEWVHLSRVALEDPAVWRAEWLEQTGTDVGEWSMREHAALVRTVVAGALPLARPLPRRPTRRRRRRR